MGVSWPLRPTAIGNDSVGGRRGSSCRAAARHASTRYVGFAAFALGSSRPGRTSAVGGRTRSPRENGHGHRYAAVVASCSLRTPSDHRRIITRADARAAGRAPRRPRDTPGSETIRSAPRRSVGGGGGGAPARRRRRRRRRLHRTRWRDPSRRGRRQRGRFRTARDLPVQAAWRLGTVIDHPEVIMPPATPPSAAPVPVKTAIKADGSRASRRTRTTSTASTSSLLQLITSHPMALPFPQSTGWCGETCHGRRRRAHVSY